jgi:hypothetical protein
MSKNRKSYVYVLQIEGKSALARVYRIKRNQAVFIGAAACPDKDFSGRVERFLLKRRHISSGHRPGRDFFLESV